MKHDRPAYTLMEMLAVIAAMVVLMALSVKPVRMLLSDIPRSNRDFRTWKQTQEMLRLLKEDVEHSTQIGIVEMNSDASNRQLHLQQTNKRLIYILTDDAVVRKSNQTQDKWELPHVKIRWEMWKNEELPYAIEVTTWTERRISKKTQKKYEQSFVYFQKKGVQNHENQ